MQLNLFLKRGKRELQENLAMFLPTYRTSQLRYVKSVPSNQKYVGTVRIQFFFFGLGGNVTLVRYCTFLNYALLKF